MTREEKNTQWIIKRTCQNKIRRNFFWFTPFIPRGCRAFGRALISHEASWYHIISQEFALEFTCFSLSLSTLKMHLLSCCLFLFGKQKTEWRRRRKIQSGKCLKWCWQLWCNAIIIQEYGNMTAGRWTKLYNAIFKGFIVVLNSHCSVKIRYTVWIQKTIRLQSWGGKTTKFNVIFTLKMQSLCEL